MGISKRNLKSPLPGRKFFQVTCFLSGDIYKRGSFRRDKMGEKEKRLFKMRLGKASFGEKREKKNIYQYPCRTKTYLKKNNKKNSSLTPTYRFPKSGEECPLGTRLPFRIP